MKLHMPVNRMKLDVYVMPTVMDPQDLHRATIKFSMHSAVLVIVVIVTELMLGFGVGDQIVLASGWLTSAIQDLADYLKVV